VTPLLQHQDQFGLDAAVMATGGAEEQNRVKTEKTAEQSTGCRRPQRAGSSRIPLKISAALYTVRQKKERIFFCAHLF